MLNAILSLFRMILLLLGGYEQIALENLALREQLAIFQRSVRHPKIRLMDRVFWVCLRKAWKDWKSVLVIVRPETVLVERIVQISQVGGLHHRYEHRAS